MPLTKYKENYKLMYKIAGNIYYPNSINPNTFLDLFTDGINNFIPLDVLKFSYLDKLIFIAYNKYTVKSFGYSSAGGAIEISKAYLVRRGTKYFSDYFVSSSADVFTDPQGGHSIMIVHNNTYTEPGNVTLVETNTKYINLENWATTLGFSITFEPDDTNKILYLSGTLN